MCGGKITITSQLCGRREQVFYTISTILKNKETIKAANVAKGVKTLTSGRK
jgi:hypothetical protein